MSIVLFNINRKQLSKAITIIVLASVTHASFATTIPRDNQPLAILEPLVVTSSRIATKTSNVIAQTTVITGDELQRHQGKTAFEVIQNQADISVKQNGSMGTVNNFYLRGYDSKKVLVLIDGIRYSSVSTGQPALNLLPVEHIQRIEILKGASGSSIYGADAMGGVIQIFTKSGFNSNAFSATIGAGSNDHYVIGATGVIGDADTSMSLSASHTQTKGINATQADHSWGIHNPDNDGFSSDNLSVNAKHQLNEDVIVGMSTLYSQSDVDFDSYDSYQKISYDNTHSENKNGSVQAYADWKYADNANIKLQYGRSIDYSESKDLSYPSVYNSHQEQVNLTGKNDLPLGTAVYGAEYLKQWLDTKGTVAGEDRNVKSVFAGYQLTHDAFDMQANARRDSNSQYGKQNTYSIGGAYRPSDNVRLGAGYATGFRMPTFNDLYNSGGNVTLQPETSQNIEVFAEYKTKNKTSTSNSRITTYHNNVDDMIASDANYQRINIAKSNITGVSLTSDWSVNDYLFGLGYEYQKAVDDKSDSTHYGNSLYYRPQHKGVIYTGYNADTFDVRAEYAYTGNSYSDSANTNKLDGYGLLNVTGNYYVNDKLTLNARINNLADTSYITTPEYNTDGRNAFVSLTYQH